MSSAFEARRERPKNTTRGRARLRPRSAGFRMTTQQCSHALVSAAVTEPIAPLQSGAYLRILPSLTAYVINADWPIKNSAMVELRRAIRHSVLYERDRKVDIDRPIYQPQKYLDAVICVWRLLNDPDQATERTAINQHLLSHLNIAPTGNNSIAIDLRLQKVDK